MIEVPKKLGAAEFAVVHFQLQFKESFLGGRGALLGLRRGLRRAGRHVLPGCAEGSFDALFDPPLAADQAARRRYQRPGPPFAILSAADYPQACAAGDVFDLTATFWGDGVSRVEDFARVLRVLGPAGLRRGEGGCELVAIEAEDAAGCREKIWQEGESLSGVEVPRGDAAWWLATRLPASPLTLGFATPARLMHRGRPLFRASFERLFPFILRRVTSMLHAHCNLELVDDPRPLLLCAAQVATTCNQLGWEDWRSLEGDGGGQDLGGVSGSVGLEGVVLDDIAWVLGLGSLMNLGKGAAYGAGRYFLKGV